MRKILPKTFCVFLCVLLTLQSTACSKDAARYRFNMPYSDKNVTLNLLGKNSRSAYLEMVETARAIDEQLSSYIYGDTEKFNRADGEFFENGINILGDTEYKVKVGVGFYVYESVTLGKKLFADTNGTFSVTSKRLREMWFSANEIPDRTSVLRETDGLQNPLLIDTKTIGGEYYLEKDVMFLSSGEMSDEHACVTFEDFICGYTLDKLASVAARNGLTSAEISVGNSTAFLGKNSDSKTGEWIYSSFSYDDALLCEIILPANSFVSEVDVTENSHCLSDGVYVGGVINPLSGYPTTMIQAETGDYVQSASYVTRAIVIGSGGAVCDAYAIAACVTGKKFSDIAPKGEISAILFTSDGKAYVFGDIRLSQNSNALINEYKKITLKEGE